MLKKQDYRAYITSDAWKETRKRYWKSKLKKKCYCCDAENILLELHHRTYKTLGKEKLNHLTLVCRSCHERIHRMHKLKPKNGLWYATGRVRRNIQRKRKLKK